MEWILYVDMDAFYVNCELRVRPELRGRALIVGHRPGPGPSRAVVLSASYEARAFGVRSAQPVGEAARRCPEAEWVAPDFSRYEAASREVRAFLDEQFGVASPHSIDEASVTVEAPSIEEAVSRARMAQRDLEVKLGLPSSWGVAHRRLIAKILSDAAKPHGVVGVEPAKVAEFLAPMSVRVIPGIGPKTAEALKRHGIERVGEIAERRSSQLREILGPWGSHLAAIARGNPPPDPVEREGPRSRSTDHTFDSDLSDPTELEKEAAHLAVELADSLEKEELGYRGVAIGVRWSDFERVTRTHALAGVTRGSAALVTHSARLLHELLNEERTSRDRAVRTLTVRAERVAPLRAGQASLDRY